MKKIDYDELADKLIEQYPVEENSELYSLYTSMLSHLMKVYKLAHSTAVKLLSIIERRLDIHFYRDYELSRMKCINVKKGNDVKRYFRLLYWTQKIPLETVTEIYNKYNDISSELVKNYMYENGKLTNEQINDYYYSRDYYYKHHEGILARKRAYRAHKKKEKEISMTHK